LADDVAQNKENVKKTVRALSLLIPGVEHTNMVEEWREKPLHCHHLPTLKIVGASSATLQRSDDNLWDLVTMIQFDDCILYGPNPRHKMEEESKSFLHRMLHPRKRFKSPNLFYRYLSRVILEMSLHVWLFYYISQSAVNVHSPTRDGDRGLDAYYVALLETLQFSCGADIDIAKHWCDVMQSQLYRMCGPDTSISIKDFVSEKDNDERQRLLNKHGQRPPPVVRLCGF